MKKVLISGKGGVGKSFLTYLLAEYLLERGDVRVIILDADESNRGLMGYFGFEEPALTLLDFMGGKKAIKQKLRNAMKSGASEPELSLFESERIYVDEIPAEFKREKGGLTLIAVGKIKEPLEGCACPMGVLAREFLRRLHLRKDEILLVDTEAGIEHFGRGLEREVDIIIAVAEPYFEALELAERIYEYGLRLEKQVFGVLNKYNLIPESRIKELLKDLKLPFVLRIPFLSEFYGGRSSDKDHPLNSILREFEEFTQRLGIPRLGELQ